MLTRHWTDKLVFVCMVFSLLPVISKSSHVSEDYFRSRCGLNMVPNQVADVVREFVTRARCSSLCARDVCCISLVHTKQGDSERGNCLLFYSFPADCSGLRPHTNARYLIRETDEHPCVSFSGSCAVCGYNNPATTELATAFRSTTDSLEMTLVPSTTTEMETTVITTIEGPTDQRCNTTGWTGYCVERSFYDCVGGIMDASPGLCLNPSYECCWHLSDRFCYMKDGVCQRKGVDPCTAGIYFSNHCAGPAGRSCCLSQEDTDVDCWQLGGFCDDPGFYSCVGGTIHTGGGLCSTPGEQCCAISADDACRIGRGVCQSDTQACNGIYRNATSSMCAGPESRRCCSR